MPAGPKTTDGLTRMVSDTDHRHTEQNKGIEVGEMALVPGEGYKPAL